MWPQPTWVGAPCPGRCHVACSLASRVAARLLVTGLLIANFLIAVALPARAQAVREGFRDELVVGVASPTAIAFLPDGRMLVATKGGTVRVWDGSSSGTTLALDLSAKTCSNSERGLLGLAIDPSFTQNGYVYLFYTHRNTGTCGTRSTQGPVNRVSRFRFATMDGIDDSSETVLLDNIWSFGGNHNAGDLEIGADGHLYVSTGDGGTDYRTLGGAANNAVSRDRYHLMGKILRITRVGGIPPDNPYTGVGTVRCNLGPGSPGQICQETYSWGLRNPFRMAFNPNVDGVDFAINDVGQGAWEEINRGEAGADYGWNDREGPCETNSSTICSPDNPPAAGITDPIFAYNHGDAVPGTTVGNCRSITGGAFVPDGFWPEAFDGSYLFADFVCGTVFSLHEESDQRQANVLLTEMASSSVTHLRFGPAGAGQVLYYTTFEGGGQVRRLVAEASSLATVSAASFDAGPVARGSIVSGFGQNLAGGTAAATSLPLPEELGGIEIRILQEGQPHRNAQLFFVSPEQVNFLLPDNLVAGRAALELLRDGQVVASDSVLVQELRPAIFTGSQSGRGVSAALAVLVQADGTQEPVPVFTCAEGTLDCQPVALPRPGQGQQLFLSLFATGVRHAVGPQAVQVTVDGQPVPVTFAGSQPQFAGLDQVNVELPRDLPGGRPLEVRVRVGRHLSSPVVIVLE
jgi:uncharacterized protein (TIGR03437 family)